VRAAPAEAWLAYSRSLCFACLWPFLADRLMSRCPPSSTCRVNHPNPIGLPGKASAEPRWAKRPVSPGNTKTSPLQALFAHSPFRQNIGLCCYARRKDARLLPGFVFHPATCELLSWSRGRALVTSDLSLTPRPCVCRRYLSLSSSSLSAASCQWCG
jgi:hypothetical protein